MKNIIFKHFIFIFVIFFFITSCSPRVVDLERRIVKDKYQFSDIRFPAIQSEPWNDQSQARKYLIDVDYEVKNQTVFVDMENLTQYSIDHDAWDIAIMLDKGLDKPYVIANSGDYGSGVRFIRISSVSSYGGDSVEAALGAQAIKAQQVSFKTDRYNLSPYQNGTPNPIKNALEDGFHYLVLVWDLDYINSEVFAIQFQKTANDPDKDYRLKIVKYSIAEISDGDSFIEDPQKTIQRVDGDEKYLDIKLSKYQDYDGVYIKLRNSKLAKYNGYFADNTHDNIIDFYPYVINELEYFSVLDESLLDMPYLKIYYRIPKKTNWHIKCTRTNTYSADMGNMLKNDGIVETSSILINTSLNTKVASLYGWDFIDVKAVPDNSVFKDNFDAIGGGYSNPISPNFEQQRKAWYFGKSMPPTFYLNQNTYVLKIPNGYVKFRPGSFYGPKGEKFYMWFRHQYIEN